MRARSFRSVPFFHGCTLVAMSSNTSCWFCPPVLQGTVRDRVTVGYAVAPDRVGPHLPEGVVPDTHDGQAYVCLVGVQLLRVRVLGLSSPGFRRVPAVELQVPVRERDSAEGRRGTMTLQAHVSRRLVAWGARLLYGEPVTVASMQPVWRERGEQIEATYRFDCAGREQRLRVVGETPPVESAPDARTAFLMERSWRYGTDQRGRLLHTHLDHSRGAVHRVKEHHVTVRWASVYGEEWGFLAERAPTVVLFEPGGPMTLGWRKILT